MRSPFKDRFGAPSPSVPTDIRFRDEVTQLIWTKNLRSVGSGWFMDRFLYLFGSGMARLNACLEAWSFLVPPGKERIIVGRNAYGTQRAEWVGVEYLSGVHADEARPEVRQPAADVDNCSRLSGRRAGERDGQGIDGEVSSAHVGGEIAL